MRKDRVSLDAKMMGPEPLFTDEDQEAIALEQENGKMSSLAKINILPKLFFKDITLH